MQSGIPFLLPPPLPLPKKRKKKKQVFSITEFVRHFVSLVRTLTYEKCLCDELFILTKGFSLGGYIKEAAGALNRFIGTWRRIGLYYPCPTGRKLGNV